MFQKGLIPMHTQVRVPYKVVHCRTILPTHLCIPAPLKQNGPYQPTAPLPCFRIPQARPSIPTAAPVWPLNSLVGPMWGRWVWYIRWCPPVRLTSSSTPAGGAGGPGWGRHQPAARCSAAQALTHGMGPLWEERRQAAVQQPAAHARFQRQRDPVTSEAARNPASSFPQLQGWACSR